MVDPITSEVNGNAALQFTPAFAQAAPPPPPPPEIAPDTALLSTASQALLLQQQGLNPSEIAALLGVSTTVIDSELGIAAAAAPVTTTTTPATG
jgi:hypothetical protein